MQLRGTYRYLSSKHLDPENIESLPSDILCTHIDDALHAKFGADSSRGHAVLTSSCLSDYSRFSNAARQEDLVQSCRRPKNV